MNDLSPPGEFDFTRESLESGQLTADWSHSQVLQRLERREAMLRAASFAAAQLLGREWSDCTEAILRRIGGAADVSRVYLFESHCHEDSWFITQTVEWVAPGISPQIDNPELQNMKMESGGLRNWAETLSGDGVVQGRSGDFPADIREHLQQQDILSIALVPIQVDGVWWGMLGFDECRTQRFWDESDIEVLRLLADMIGAAITRGRSDVALRESEGELRALFNAMDDAIFVLDREGVYRKAVSNSPELLYKPVAQLEGFTLQQVIGGEIAQEFLRVVRDVVDTQSSRRFEYNLTIDERELWFSASVTPLSDETVLWVARDITEAHEAREALRESESLFRLLTENSSDQIARISPEGKLLYISPSVETMLGYTPQEFMEMNSQKFVHPDDHEYMSLWYRRLATQRGRVEEATYRILHRDGEYRWFETDANAIRNTQGQIIEIHSVSRDVTQRRTAEEALRQAEAKYRSIFENAVEGIFQTTADGTYVDANPSLARIYGYDSPAELKAALTDIGNQLYIASHRRLDFVAEMQEKGSVSNFEAQIRRKDGEIIWISENARAVRNGDGELIYYEGTVEDITARKTAQEQLLHDALHDKLTGLANRALFMDRMGQAFTRLRRHPETLFAVLFLDFDRFKNVNDSLGHMAGDQLLIGLSGRLQCCLRPGDTVSRLGGDEFAILLEDIGGVSDATMVAERIQDEMSQPFRIAGQEVFSSASIGIALGNLEYENSEDLLRDADMAMYRAKAQGKARHEVFDVGMHTRAVALLQLETDLRWAIERSEFLLRYQPIVSLDSGRIAGFEALIRWQHPERGLVSPIEFIPVAEETGWIVPIGNWVLEEACRQLSVWHSEVPCDGALLTMSVNLSGKQFSQPDLIPLIESLLQRYQLPPDSLKLEITESSIMENAQAVTDRLLQLRAIGVKLGLDDFGTGYSSLSYLHRFPLDTLKIDRSFVARMLEGGENREIVRTIVSLGRNLGMDVVAEGVEEMAQLLDLRDLSCQSGQGYFFARPLAAEEALKMISSAPIW